MTVMKISYDVIINELSMYSKYILAPTSYSGTNESIRKKNPIIFNINNIITGKYY